MPCSPPPRSVGAAGAIASALLSVAPEAHARPNVDRRGGHVAATLGASACLPGKSPCTRDPDDVVPGRTKLGFAFGGELGFRFRHLLLGAAYDFTMFTPRYDVANAADFRAAYQNSVYALLRPILPVWRFDFGADLAPGFSRQTFLRKDGTKEFSQGFSIRLGPVVDLFLTRRFFLGARLSFLVNAHGRTCIDDGDTRTCARTSGDAFAGVHPLFFGVHLGGTFL